MIPFREFITEEVEEGQKLRHLEHVNRLHITGGHEGMARAAESLDTVHNMLLGKKMKGHSLTTKWDGAPSIVYGYHPENGQFFVSSKSAFNKNPKINFTPEDIEANHGHAPGLVEKLKAALEHLPKSMPPRKKVGGRYPDQVYQGDLLHSGKSDIETRDGRVTFRPNTVEYSVPKNSAEGQTALRSKLGIVTHTRYKGNNLASMMATPDVNRGDFVNHPDVHSVDPKVKIDAHNYTPEMQTEYARHMDAATRAYRGMKPEAFDATRGHEIPLESYLNGIIRNSATTGQAESPSVEGYVNHLNNIAKRDIDKVKTEGTKEKKRRAHAAGIQHVYNNAEHFQKLMDMDQHISNAKNVLVRALNNNSEYGTHLGGQASGHEGFVHVDKGGNMQKFVDQSPTGFAAANLAGAGRIAQGR